jgi:hypothetical protein
MALTPFRWLALAALGCMFVFFSLVELREARELPLTVRGGNVFDSTEERLRSKVTGAQQAAQYLAERYRILQITDSVKRVASRSKETDGMRVFIDAAFPATEQSLLRSMIDRAARAKLGASGVGVDVFAVTDLATSVRGVGRYPLTWMEVRYEIPRTPGDRCRVYVRSGQPSAETERELRSQSAPEQLLGPCAFFAAFGQPGPKIREWLLAGGWAYATDGSWTGTPQNGWQNRRRMEIFKGPAPALYYLRVESKAPACIVGDLAACEAIATVGGTRSRTRPVGSYTAGLTLGRYRYFPSAMGQFGGEFLADVVGATGRERFKAFWTSPDSVPQAYAAASGKSWGQEIREWMIAKYGEIEAGPRVTGYALLMSALLVGLAMAVVFRSSLTRRYA